MLGWEYGTPRRKDKSRQNSKYSVIGVRFSWRTCGGPDAAAEGQRWVCSWPRAQSIISRTLPRTSPSGLSSTARRWRGSVIPKPPNSNELEEEYNLEKCIMRRGYRRLRIVFFGD